MTRPPQMRVLRRLGTFVQLPWGGMDKTDHYSEQLRQELIRSHLEKARSSLLFYHCDGTELVGLAPNMALTIGREAPCDVEIPDRTLSRHHARITTSDDAIWLEDLGSTNGTFVNGKRISERANIYFGDQVALGSVAVVIEAHGTGDAHARLEGHDRFVRRLGEEMTRARTFGRPFALLMVEGTGNRVSRWADRVLSKVRPVDRAAIWAQDCLEILLPETDRAQAGHIGESMMGGKGEELRFGVAAFPDDASSVDALLDKCRSTLQGRNRADLPSAMSTGVVVGSQVMRELFDQIARVARSTLPVLLLGETGVGKEVVARHLHASGPRAAREFIAINCGAIPANLVESTLFGHEAGSFTGAQKRRVGVLEQASGGTVLLDEIGELPLDSQVALLRALDAKRITRVGGTQEIELDLRIVAATHRDLAEMSQQGTFRQDLLFRINTMTLTVAPLRERRQDIEPLVERFVANAAAEHGTSLPEVSPQAMRAILQHNWPGNVRELKNAIERAVVICRDGVIVVDDLPESLRCRPGAPPIANETNLTFKERIAHFETRLVLEALRACDGNQTQAAEMLGMPRRTFVHKLKTLGVRKLGYEVRPESD